MNDKPFYLSKTLWVNAITVIGGFVAKKAGIEFSGEDALAVLGIVNMILRVVTKGSLQISAKSA